MDSYASLQERAHEDSIVSTVVGMMVVRQRHLLLLKRRADDFLPNVWEIPGGHVDPGETILDACARELREETGLSLLRIVAHVGGYDYDGEFGRTRQWNFWVEAGGGTVIHPEHTEYRWVAPSAWNSLAMTEEMRKSLDHFATTRLKEATSEAP